MADHLPDLFRSTGLAGVKRRAQDEVVERGEPKFAGRTALWSEVIESVGGQLATAGFCTELQLAKARECYAAWVREELVKQTLVMRAVTGIVP
jgi:hypothetical protein